MKKKTSFVLLIISLRPSSNEIKKCPPFDVIKMLKISNFYEIFFWKYFSRTLSNNNNSKQNNAVFTYFICNF